jgi:hypothetical protein
MRSTAEIVCAVKECRPVTEEELRMALLVLNSTEYFLKRNLEKLLEAVEGKKPLILSLRTAEAKRWVQETLFTAHKADPAVWLGPSGTPGNPEHDQFHQLGLRMVERLIAQHEAEGK